MMDNTQINEKRRKIFKAAGIAGLAGFIGLAIPKAVRGAVYFREDDGSMKNLSNMASTKQANTWTQAQTFQGTVSGVGQRISFSDTTTTINPGVTYTKSISLGKSNYIGGILFLQQDAGESSNHVIIIFTNSSSDASGHSFGGSPSYDMGYSKVAGDAYLTHKMFSTIVADVCVDDCYISGSDLKIIFENYNGVDTRTLSVYGHAVVFQA